jgi:ABC-type iron transport system FetAB ATPase subunit
MAINASKIRELPDWLILDANLSELITSSKREIEKLIYGAKYVVKDKKRVYVTNFENYDRCKPIERKTFLDSLLKK